MLYRFPEHVVVVQTSRMQLLYCLVFPSANDSYNLTILHNTNWTLILLTVSSVEVCDRCKEVINLKPKTLSVHLYLLHKQWYGLVGL